MVSRDDLSFPPKQLVPPIWHGAPILQMKLFRDLDIED